MTGQSSPAGDNNPGDLAPPACTIGHHRIGQVAVVAVTGTVDMLTAPLLDTAIRSAAGDNPAAIVIDLTEVEFLASAGMGVLAATNNDLAPDIRYVLVADGPATSRPLRLVGLAEIVELFATLDQALTAVTT
ncbi:STAS domain-containing protein [Mycolicibacterium sp. CBMA 226]|uniref:STAS domain-containing protein n=1 Tax=Mycolicibacterium sp. CBMA 226 TaxID=2606611 RepID=UPI0012DC3D82|nr:STAS domain-containing protein [Mycolicibacterium sp. CBMA 226]MUL79608.1 STAS domain-containing protein [Mycolicibacterium sp. CBMA 226]